MTLVFSPLILLADYTPLAPLPDLAPGVDNGSFTYFIQNSFYLLIGVAGVLAVIMIMLGGIQYMSTDAIGGKEEGKEKITKALLGLLLAIGAWLILNTINPNILSLDLSTEEILPPENYEVDKDPYVVNKGRGTFSSDGQQNRYICQTYETKNTKKFEGKMTCENDIAKTAFFAKNNENTVVYNDGSFVELFYLERGECDELACVLDESQADN